MLSGGVPLMFICPGFCGTWRVSLGLSSACLLLPLEEGSSCSRPVFLYTSASLAQGSVYLVI
jgi:hypothetical protein